MNMTKSGTNYKFGDVVLAQVYFVDMKETKNRPALILFEKYGNVVIMGITSNKNMEGIQITKEEGAATESIIKTNYIFTISKESIRKKLFSITEEKKGFVCNELKEAIGCQ